MARKQKNGNLPAIAEPAPREPVKVSLSGEFLRAGELSLDRVQGYLGLQIDIRQLVDPEWLRDPENRKIALVLHKFAALQANLALGVISGQIRVGTAIREDHEKELGRQRVIRELCQQFGVGNADG
jgi:hypothetical protein